MGKCGKICKKIIFRIQRTRFDNISTLEHKLGITFKILMRKFCMSKCVNFVFFNFFFTHMTVHDFLNQQKSTKFDMDFRMVRKLSYMDNKKILSFFSIRGDPYQKKVKNFFFSSGMEIYTPIESPCQI